MQPDAGIKMIVATDQGSPETRGMSQVGRKAAWGLIRNKLFIFDRSRFTWVIGSEYLNAAFLKLR